MSENTAAGTFTVTGSMSNVGTFYNYGNLTVNNSLTDSYVWNNEAGAMLYVAAGATMTVGNATLYNVGTVYVYGTLTNVAGEAEFNQQGTVTIESSGTMTTGYWTGNAGAGTISDSGKLIVNGGAESLQNQATLNVLSGGQLTDVAGAVTQDLAGAVITVASSGSMSIVGTLDITGSFSGNLTDGGSVVF